MDHLPLGDIPMLVSCINFLLRDEEFENLDQICYCFNVEREEMDRILASGGYKYRPEQNSVLWAMDHSAIELAYAFFHQKERVYRFSTSEAEKDHIEDAISTYVNQMSPELYDADRKSVV